MEVIWSKNKQDKDLITDRDAKSTAYDEKIRPAGLFYSRSNAFEADFHEHQESGGTNPFLTSCDFQDALNVVFNAQQEVVTCFWFG
jgi:hypothetical protein